MQSARYDTPKVLFITNSTMNSSLFPRDLFLKRQARARDAHNELYPSSSLTMIEEEDEPRSSYSRSPSPMAGRNAFETKPKRRHGNLSVSDIRRARTALVHDDNDISQKSTLLSSPRPAPRPPTSPTPSPEPSPDPFSLKFPDSSFRFPHPPIPTPSSSMFSFNQRRTGSESPTLSISSSSISTSPESRSVCFPITPSSSDDEFASPFNPRRVSIKPLAVTKRNTTTSYRPTSNLAPEHPSEYISTSDSEESDSEWYTREFSKILTLSSPLPPNFPQKTRPESMCVPPACTPTASPTPSQGYPSAQLDPAFPRRSRRSRISIPKYPPPPVPSIPAHLRSPSISSSPSTPQKSYSRPRSNVLYVTPPPVRRPPPRSSIPVDFVDDDDNMSTFSLSLYDDCNESPGSFYSQTSFQSPNPSPFPASFPSTPSSIPSPAEDDFDFPLDNVQFDMDLDSSMMLPLSLPCSPIDLEADIASGLHDLGLERLTHPTNHPRPTPSPAARPSPPSSSSSSEGDDTRDLRSRWSSSTLNSIREEHARRGASAKILSYFGAPSPRLMTRAFSGSRKLAPPMSPMTPSSPSKRFRHPGRESDVGHGLRRRGSVTTSVSDAGSDESSSSTSSSGLRRKPIPVEMFLRTTN